MNRFELAYVLVACASLLFATLQTAAHGDIRNEIVVVPYSVVVPVPTAR